LFIEWFLDFRLAFALEPRKNKNGKNEGMIFFPYPVFSVYFFSFFFQFNWSKLGKKYSACKKILVNSMSLN
jgi:hypothetical protein